MTLSRRRSAVIALPTRADRRYAHQRSERRHAVPRML